MIKIPRQILAEWAAARPSIKALYVFGSYARDEARTDSDLDLAFDFNDPDDALSELIVNAAKWKADLSRLTGLTVKDLRLSTDAVAQGVKVRIFAR